MITELNIHSLSALSRPPRSRWRQLVSGVMPVLLLGCSAMPMTAGVAVADNHSAETDGQLMYEIMIAELAGRRGYLDAATEGYMRAAQRTDDERVSARAAQLAVFSRQWDKAEIAATRWLELAPDSLEPHELLAQIMLRQEKPTAAAEEFAVLVDADADNRDVVLRDIYAVLLREPEVEQSLIVMRALQERYPQEVESHLGVARLLLGQNEREMALEQVEVALGLSANHHEALLIKAQILSDMGRPAEGFAELQAAIDNDETNVDLRLGYARLLVDAGRYADASRELEIIYDLAPDNGDALLTIGLLALDSKRIDAASRYLTQLRDTGEHADQAHFYLGRISDQQQEFEAAIDYYEQVLPGDMFLTAQIRSAELYAAIDELDVGIQRLRDLATSLPDPAMQPRLLTAEGRMLQEAGRADDAVEVLSDGLQKFPENGDLLYARALAADSAGDSAMLQADLGKLIEAEPENAHALNALGYFLADENIRLDEAQVYLEKANRLKPNDAAIMDSLGWLRYRQGQNDSAITLLREAYKLFPDGEIAAHLGEVLWINGEQSAARSLWDKALLETPDDATLKQVVKRFTQ